MDEKKIKKYIDECIRVHEGKYSYDKVGNPRTTKDNIIVTCPVHGDFKTTFDRHLRRKTKCPFCSGVGRRSTENFVNELKEIFKDRNFDYSEVVYTNNREKVRIYCKEKDVLGNEHGWFEAAPRHLLKGHGCPKCAHRYLTTEEVVAMAKQVHGDKYDYSLLEYHNNNNEKLPIICHEKDENGVEHGVFTPAWHSHLKGCGCPKCNGGIRGSFEEFVKRANEVHNGYYNYDKFKYINATTHGIITCPRHGDFLQTPYAHVNMKHGCPKCKSSRLEITLISAFNKNKIDYDFQVSFPELGKKTIDFKLNNKQICIECQGEQHYVPTKFSKKITNEQAEKAFRERVKLDKEKYEITIKNGCEMIYFTDPYIFHGDGIDIHAGFYADKKVFTNTNDLINYINGIERETSDCTLTKFMDDVKQLNNLFRVSGDKAKYKNTVIHFNFLNVSDPKKMIERRRSYVKRGYKVIDVFEDEYVNHRDIVISKIKHIIKLSADDIKINARQCIVSEINGEVAKEFLNKNHIQGYVGSTLYFGCYYKNELISVMSFLEYEQNKWNLTRFATLEGTICRGVAGKLFSFFVKKYNPSEVKSFADRRWTCDEKDNLYIKLGFEYDGSTIRPEYRYWKKGETVERAHKFGFRKQKLAKKYGFSMAMTESEMAKALGYTRIWDCGLFKYVWRNKEEIFDVVDDE